MAVGNEMKALFPQEYESKFWKERTRSDGRSFDQVRPTAITCNVISSMDSSCMVKTGSTTVLAGCKLEIGTPSVSSPNQGEIELTSHFSPVCSNRYAVGRPADESYCLTAALMRIIEGTRLVNLEDLCIETGAFAWKVDIDVVCLDDDGNSFDAALLAVVGALKQLQLPKTSLADDGIMYIVPGTKNPLDVHEIPVALSFGVMEDENVVLADPVEDEEGLAASVVTIAYTATGKLCSVNVIGSSPVPMTKLKNLMVAAKQRAAESRDLLSQALG